MSATITSITGLQNLNNLQRFVADWNSLSTVNVSGLSNLNYLDLSDNETLDTNNPSLTSVTLTGCTSLEELRLDDSDFSAGIPDLTGLNSLQWIDMDQCGITGNVDLSMLPALYGFDLGGNAGITSVTIFEQVLNNVNVSNAALTEASVNDILGWLDGGGETNGYVDLEGGTNAIPTGSGLTAVTNLQGKGWDVYINTPPTTTSTTTIAGLQIKWERGDSGNACSSTNYIYLTGNPDICTATDVYGDFSSVIDSGSGPGTLIVLSNGATNKWMGYQVIDSTRLTSLLWPCNNC